MYTQTDWNSACEADNEWFRRSLTFPYQREECFDIQQAVYEILGIKISSDEAQDVWETYSAEYDASFLVLPNKETIAKVFERYMYQQLVDRKITLHND